MGDISLESVSKAFGDRVAVDQVSLEIKTGDFVTLLGPSGCGKTTTLNLIAGLEDLTSGSIQIDGRRVDELPPHRRDLAFVFQDYALYPHMSVYDNMAFGLKMRKVPKAEIDSRVREAAERLGIGHVLGIRPRALSGGQRQRVALGRCIVRRPAIFLYDEPLSNLDAAMRESARDELLRLHRELGATSLYVTHDQEEAVALSDYIAVMRAGRLVQYGKPWEIYNRPMTEWVAGFVGRPAMNLFDAEMIEEGRIQIIGSELVVSAFAASNSKRVRLGLRPDEIGVGGDNCPAGNRAVVEAIRAAGGATDLTLRIGRVALLARVPGFWDSPVGSVVCVDLSRAHAHVFEPDSGTRINRVDGSEVG